MMYHMSFQITYLSRAIFPVETMSVVDKLYFYTQTLLVVLFQANFFICKDLTFLQYIGKCFQYCNIGFVSYGFYILKNFEYRILQKMVLEGNH